MLKRALTITVLSAILIGCGQGQSMSGASREAVFEATFVRNHDGDTMTINEGGHVYNVRLLGIDSPEIDGQCPKEINWALEDRALLYSHMTRYPHFTFTKQGHDNTEAGRPLVVVYAGGLNVSDMMLDRGHARVWDGVWPYDWCSYS